MIAMQSVMVYVTLGNPNVARAGSGKAAKIASSTSDIVGEEHGYVAAERAAAKFFECDRRAFFVRCITPGNQCNGRKAVFEAERVAV